MGLLRNSQVAAVSRRDRKFVGRTGDTQNIEVVAASGSRLRDARGKTFIDGMSGYCVANLGYNPPEIMARVRAYEGPSYLAPNMIYEPWVELAEQLVDIAPGNLAKAYRVVSGTEAVELALELAVAATGRHKFISIDEAYHGNSLGVRSLGSEALDAHLMGCKKLAPPLDAHALGRLETLLKEREVAAFIMEPLITNLAVLIPGADFMRELVPLCHKYGTLVIMDEVACGWGRSGKLFASEHYDIAPDMMTLAKAITSGVAPLGATLVTNEVAKAVGSDFDFYSTFGWHPLAVEAALATQAYWREHKAAVLTNVQARSDELRHRLSITDFKTENIELRIQGLAVGIGVGDEAYASHIVKVCHDSGLLLTAEDDAVVMFPPLTIDHDTLAEALDILADAARR